MQANAFGARPKMLRQDAIAFLRAPRKVRIDSFTLLRYEPPEAEVEVLRPRPRGPQFSIEREDGAFRVIGDRPVVLVEMLALQSDESRAETMRRLGRMGVTAALKRAGARRGDPVRFGHIERRWDE